MSVAARHAAFPAGPRGVAALDVRLEDRVGAPTPAKKY